MLGVARPSPWVPRRRKAQVGHSGVRGASNRNVEGEVFGNLQGDVQMWAR